jgi:hypothetical protein
VSGTEEVATSVVETASSSRDVRAVTSDGGSAMLSGPSTASASSISLATSIDALDSSIDDGHGPGSATPAMIDTASGAASAADSGSNISANVVALATTAPATTTSIVTG